VQRTAIGGSLKTRIELQTDQPELAVLVTAVNHLLARASLASSSRRQAVRPSARSVIACTRRC
jgi:hypothetical protein